MSESDPSGPLPAVRRMAWTAGEFVHRRLGDGEQMPTGRGARPETAGADGPLSRPSATGPNVPTYPYGETGGDPVRPRPAATSNPVLTAADVDDYGDVDFVADPFLFPGDGVWHLFFEVFNRDRRPTGVVGHATSDDGGRSWRYDGVVLWDGIHLAFPYVFKWDGQYYMIPDRWNRESPADVRIYRTDALPDGWEAVSTVVEPDTQLADCVVFRWDGRWWAILGSDDGNYELHVYYADELTTDRWTAHERNPVVAGRPSAARPGGRPIVRNDRILVFFQDCLALYGGKVRAFDIERLTPSEYEDRSRPENPVLEASDGRFGWNSGRMHHIDPWYTDDGWVSAVDGNIGFGRRAFGPDHWSIGLYRG
jgi:hypothetical protein